MMAAEDYWHHVGFDGKSTIYSRACATSVYTRDLFGLFSFCNVDNDWIAVNHHLQDYFEDWLHPIESEIALFELQFEIPFVPQKVLDQVHDSRQAGEYPI